MKKCIFAVCSAICLGLLLFLSIEAKAGFSVNIAPAKFALEPGETQMSSVLVTNNGDEPVRVKIYVGDWVPVENGTRYLPPGEFPRGASRWTRVSPTRLSVAPGCSEEVFYEVSLPRDGNLAGSYWGMVFVEEIPPGAEELPRETDRPDMAVRTVVRYAVKVYVTIPGTEIRKATFAKVKLSPVKDGFDIAAAFENQGNVYLQPLVWLELYDRAGTVVHSKPHQLKTVLPESTYNYTFELRDLNLPLGRYTALIIADYDAPSLIAAQAEIQIER